MDGILVIDTETTGDGPEDEVMELAGVLLTPGETGWRETARQEGYIKPLRAVCSPEARAVHHIPDSCLDLAPTMAELVAAPVPRPSAPIWAAHNAEFDERLLLQSGGGDLLPSRKICTWRCALHLWPDAPSHKNQVLRYWLNVHPDLPPGLHPHRALYDALVTAAILQRMLEMRTVQELEILTTQPVLLTTCRFGKHRGQRWADLPSDYLRWILRSRAEPFGEDALHTARSVLADRSPP
jgi:exodeoxyribonuclease X